MHLDVENTCENFVAVLRVRVCEFLRVQHVRTGALRSFTPRGMVTLNAHAYWCRAVPQRRPKTRCVKCVFQQKVAFVRGKTFSFILLNRPSSCTYANAYFEFLFVYASMVFGAVVAALILAKHRTDTQH